MNSNLVIKAPGRSLTIEAVLICFYVLNELTDRKPKATSAAKVNSLSAIGEGLDP